MTVRVGGGRRRARTASLGLGRILAERCRHRDPCHLSRRGARPRFFDPLAVTTVMLFLLPLAGCQERMPPSTPSLVGEVSPTASPAARTATPIVSPTVIPVVTRSVGTVLPRSPTPVVHTEPGPLYQTIFSIPIGQDGIQYRGLDVPDMEITGPNNLAVLPDGTFVIADLIGNRLLWYSPVGELLREMDLYALDILNVSHLRAADEGLILLEVSFRVAPDRYRIHRLSVSGDLLASYDLPEGLHLEDGLSGIGAGCSGEILVELEGSAQLYQLVESEGTHSFRYSSEGYPCDGRFYKMLLGPLAVLGEGRVETALTYGMGGLLLLQANPDGSSYVIRDDVVSDPVIVVDRTVHLMDVHGRQLGVAREPISERLYYVPGDLAVGPDGEVYHLLPRRDRIDVVRLNFYEALAPLFPEAQPPLVITLNGAP